MEQLFGLALNIAPWIVLLYAMKCYGWFDIQ